MIMDRGEGAILAESSKCGGSGRAPGARTGFRGCLATYRTGFQSSLPLASVGMDIQHDVGRVRGPRAIDCSKPVGKPDGLSRGGTKAAAGWGKHTELLVKSLSHGWRAWRAKVEAGCARTVGLSSPLDGAWLVFHSFISFTESPSPPSLLE